MSINAAAFATAHSLVLVSSALQMKWMKMCTCGIKKGKILLHVLSIVKHYCGILIC